MPEVKVQKDSTSWDSQNIYIERMMDNAAYSAAHPDDTIVLVGPPRFGNSSIADLKPVGMMQNFSINQAKPFQPMMAIGSGRQFFLGGKAQGSAQIGRLFVNGKSLMHKLYDNYKDIKKQAGDYNVFSEPASAANSNFFINLDSELFLIPFGLGAVIRDKSKTIIGSFYLELCVIPNHTMGLAAGQSMILEQVTVLYDRVVPLPVDTSVSSFEAWNTILSSKADGKQDAEYLKRLNDI